MKKIILDESDDQNPSDLEFMKRLGCDFDSDNFCFYTNEPANEDTSKSFRWEIVSSTKRFSEPIFPQTEGIK